MPSFTCTERGKTIVRNVWLMEYNVENLKQLWNKSKEHRILFSDDVHGDFDKFCNIFFSFDQYENIQAKGLVWIMDDFVGMLYMSEITTSECKVHFSFFDGRLREDVSREMLHYIFEEYDFFRINIDVVPFASPRLFTFLSNLGFRKEGIKRKSLLYKNQRFDTLLFGLLREEFYEKWDTTKELLAEAQQNS